jgi:hypothetical protein
MKHAVLGFALATALFVGGSAVAQQVTGEVMADTNLATVELGNAIFDLDANGPGYGCAVEVQP